MTKNQQQKFKEAYLKTYDIIYAMKIAGYKTLQTAFKHIPQRHKQ